jgi:cation-transporting ATPase E
MSNGAPPGENRMRGGSITGLTAAEVAQRIAAGQTNSAARPGGRSTWDIVRGNVFTWFNLILGVLFVAMLLFGSWKDALFGWIIFINAGIGIVQEMRAKVALDRLSLLSAPNAKVVRDGAEQLVPLNQVVLDEVMVIAAGDQVVADAETLESRGLELDESLLTGESAPVIKSPGDRLLSGSFVVAGSGLCRATAVGPDSYAQRLTREGKRYVRLRSDLVEGINGILRIIGIGIVPVGALLVWAQFRMGAGMAEGVTNTVAALVAMVPQGLVLLTSIAFAVSAVTLARRKVLTRELPAVEGLARVDVLCIDKTGTITEPRPAFERFEGLGDPTLPVEEAGGDPTLPAKEAGGGTSALEVLGSMARSAAVANSTLEAIGAALPAPAGWVAEDSVAFSSARKWSASRIVGRGSWVLGAPEIIAGEAMSDGHAEGAWAAARARAAALADEGLRVLLLARTDAPLTGEVLPPGLAPVGLAILSERVRGDAPSTLAYFREQGMAIKVISGDNPATVATIAAKAGVPGANRAVDARDLPEGAALAEIMEGTTVFGRVNPDQKRAMVEALQSRGHTVAMTGDGVNDVLALKEADMGIAMGTGTGAARAVSQLVLVDSRFSALPGVVAEGRRVTANIERVASLFTTKSVWAAALAILVAAVGVAYPILPRHLTVIDSLTIGIPAFFLALAPNARRFIPGFVYRVGRLVIPTGLLATVTVLASYLIMREMGASVAHAQTMETIVLAVIGLRVIAMIERPVRGWRLGLICAMAAIFAVGVAVPSSRNFFALGLPGWPIVGVGAATCVFAWFFVGLGWRVARVLPFWQAAASRLEGFKTSEP